MSKCLFLGGCKDGVWAAIDEGAHNVHVLDYTCFHPVRVTYVRFPLFFEGKVTCVFVREQDRHRVLDMLLKGYKS